MSRRCRCCRGPPSAILRPCGGWPSDRTDPGTSLHGLCHLSKKTWFSQDETPGTLDATGTSCPALTGPVSPTQGASAMPHPTVPALRVPARSCLVYSICLRHISLSNSKIHTFLGFKSRGRSPRDFRYLYYQICQNQNTF